MSSGAGSNSCRPSLISSDKPRAPGAAPPRRGVPKNSNSERKETPTMRNIPHLKAGPAPDDVPEYGSRQLTIFGRNCRLLAERVMVGHLRLIDAADMLQSAAEVSGLCEIVGDDVVQRTIA